MVILSVIYKPKGHEIRESGNFGVIFMKPCVHYKISEGILECRFMKWSARALEGWASTARSRFLGETSLSWGPRLKGPLLGENIYIYILPSYPPTAVGWIPKMGSRPAVQLVGFCSY